MLFTPIKLGTATMKAESSPKSTSPKKAETSPKPLIKAISAHFPMNRDIEAEFNIKEEIYIKDWEGLKKKIAAMRKDGKTKLQILTDFDYTLTRKTHQGEKADNSFICLEHEDMTGTEFSIGCSKAREIYLPIEADPMLGKEEKEKSMIKWWKHTQDLMIRAKMTKELIRVTFYLVVFCSRD